MQKIRKNTQTMQLGFLSAVALWGLGILTILGLFWSVYETTHGSQVLQIGRVAPIFSLQDQDGRTHSLRDYRNRAVALAFLPDAQHDSEAQLRSLNQNIRQFDTLGLKVFAIAPIEASAAKRLHDKERLEFPILTDTGRKVARQYGIETSNTTSGRISYVIDRDGRVLLPITTVNAADPGKQLSELSECCLDTRPPAGSKLIGKPIADFALPRVSDGVPETLYGPTRQKATVLFITSAECPCSGRYVGRMAELARVYGPQGVRFMAMNSSFDETPKGIADKAQQAGFTLPILKDAGNVIADRIGAQVTPEAFVMDAQGILRYHGCIDDSRDPEMIQNHYLRNALDLLLAGKSPSPAEVVTFGCAILRAPQTAQSSQLTPKEGSSRP